MADRSVHYEAAFEDYLRSQRIPCIAVDEARKAIFANAKLKSFDFVVYSKKGPNLLVDVKGRKMQSSRGQGSYQTWATRQDVDDLLQWQQVFGENFKALLVFSFWIDTPMAPERGMYEYAQRWYWMLGVELCQYRQCMRQRSPRWDTVSLPIKEFRSLARPIEDWL